MKYFFLLFLLSFGVFVFAAPAGDVTTCESLGLEPMGVSGHPSVNTDFFDGITACLIQIAEPNPYEDCPSCKGVDYEYLSGEWKSGWAGGNFHYDCGYNLPDAWIIDKQYWRYGKDSDAPSYLPDGSVLPPVSDGNSFSCIREFPGNILIPYEEEPDLVRYSGVLRYQKCAWEDDTFGGRFVRSWVTITYRSTHTPEPIFLAQNGDRGLIEPCPRQDLVNHDYYCFEYPNSGMCSPLPPTTCDEVRSADIASSDPVALYRGSGVDFCTGSDCPKGTCLQGTFFTTCRTRDGDWVKDNFWIRDGDSVTNALHDWLASKHIRIEASRNCEILDGLLPPLNEPDPWYCQLLPILCSDTDPPNGDYCRQKHGDDLVAVAKCLNSGDDGSGGDGSGGSGGDGSGGSGGDGSGGDGPGGDGSGGDGSGGDGSGGDGSGGSGGDGSGGDGSGGDGSGDGSGGDGSGDGGSDPDPEYCELYPSAASCGGSSGGGGDGGNDDGGGGGEDPGEEGCERGEVKNEDGECVEDDADSECGRICERVQEISDLMSTKFPFGMGSWLSFGFNPPSSGCQDFQISMFGSTTMAGWCSHPIYGFMRSSLRAGSLLILLFAVVIGTPRSVGKM